MASAAMHFATSILTITLTEIALMEYSNWCSRSALTICL